MGLHLAFRNISETTRKKFDKNIWSKSFSLCMKMHSVFTDVIILPTFLFHNEKVSPSVFRWFRWFRCLDDLLCWFKAENPVVPTQAFTLLVEHRQNWIRAIASSYERFPKDFLFSCFKYSFSLFSFVYTIMRNRKNSVYHVIQL